jgi:glycosyltransferase involved in cell wall biosynthesis
MNRPHGSDAIRVMRIITRMNIGGATVHVVQLDAGLTAAGYDCLLVTGSEGASEGSMRDLALARRLRLADIPELGREIAPLSDLVALLKLYRLMRRERPHIVHTHLAKAGFLGRIAARLAGVPVVLHTFHGHVFHGYFSPAKTRVFLAMERFGARLSTRIITSSPRLREEIAGYGVTTPEHIAVIPYGFELDAFAAHPRGGGAFRRSLGIPERAKLVGAVGRLVPIKNLPLLLEAAALARQQQPDIHVVLVGIGELHKELEARVADLGMTGAVTFAGWQADLPSVYADLDAVVISSDNEGTPVTLIEAMAAGCPVVATRVGGVPDLIADGETGRLVPPRDREALAAALLALLADPQRTGQMASAARQSVLARYQVQRLVGDVDALYQELLRAAGQLPGNTRGTRQQDGLDEAKPAGDRGAAGR